MSNLVRHSSDSERFFRDNGGHLWPFIPKRYELSWIAGERGKPSLNADFVSTTESENTIADRHFELLGGNMTSALSTFNAEGGITLTTAGGGTDGAILLPHLDANQTPWNKVTWGTDREVMWECLIETNSTLADTRIWAGLKLTNTSTVATDNDQVFVRFEDDVNSGKFQVIDSIGGTDVTTDSGLTAAVSTKYHIRIEIDSQRIARVYINGQLYRTTAALTDAIDLIPYIGIEEDTSGAAVVLQVHAQRISRLRGA